MNFFNKTVAHLIEIALKEKGLKFQDVASTLKVSARTVSYYNSANTSRHYKLEEIYIISVLLNIDIVNLIPNKISLKKIYRNYSENEIENVLIEILESLGVDENE